MVSIFARAKSWVLFSIAALFVLSCTTLGEKGVVKKNDKKRVILLVWDGLRPDAVTEKDTPNLFQLKKQGSDFSNHHSTFPTLTMVNAQAFATGHFPGKTGYYGNRIYAPHSQMKRETDSAGRKIDFNQPIFTEDYKILSCLDHPEANKPLLATSTLFARAQEEGLVTAAIGKSGPAFLQTQQSHSAVLDNMHAAPESFAEALQAKGFLTRQKAIKDFNADDFADVYLNYVLPTMNPDLSVFWLRDPDNTAHYFGTGSPEFHKALQWNDRILGRLLQKLKDLNYDLSTDIMIVSDHGHSNVSSNVDVPGLFAKQFRELGIRAFDGEDKYKVPKKLASDDVVLAENGGVLYVYAPSHKPTLIVKLARFFQSNPQFGAVFTSDKYGDVPGTLPLSSVNLENTAGRNPDLIVSLDYNEGQIVRSFPGTLVSVDWTEKLPGFHGSFGPTDVHNTLFAVGPSFRDRFVDHLPSANVDVPTTIAHILDIESFQSQGRVLVEGLQNEPEIEDSEVDVREEMLSPRVTSKKSNSELYKTHLTINGKTYTYFDRANIKK